MKLYQQDGPRCLQIPDFIDKEAVAKAVLPSFFVLGSLSIIEIASKLVDSFLSQIQPFTLREQLCGQGFESPVKILIRLLQFGVRLAALRTFAKMLAVFPGGSQWLSGSY